MIDIEKIFSSFSQAKMMVLGDVMLDNYMWGKVERISPEAPVPVVSVEKKESRIGGAGNVALNAASLGAKVFILSVTGADTEADQLKEMFRQSGIDGKYLIASTDRVTTTKTRIISRNQHMMRLDAEMVLDLHKDAENKLLDQVRACIEEEQPAVLVFEDYNKGVLTERVIKETIAICRSNKVITAVDPKRKNFFAYNDVDIFKPNLKEVKEGLNLLLEDVNQNMLDDIHEALHHQLNHGTSFITLSEKGVYYHDKTGSALFPSHVRNIADVSGAGDTVIAVASLVYAATGDFSVAARLANIAGGLVCEEVGTVAISKEKLLAECKLLLN